MRVKASFITEVDRSNEPFVRSFHPSLEFQDHVYVFQDLDGQCVWAVQVELTDQLPATHAAGRPIHLLPPFSKLPKCTWADSAITPAGDPVRRTINLRRMLNPDELDKARALFPEAVRERVLIFEWIVVLFRCYADLQSRWYRMKPSTFGDRLVGFEVLHHTPMTAAKDFTYGTVVARASHVETGPAGCLGLAIMLPSGENAITTATHCFVKLPTRSLMIILTEKAYSTI